MTTISLSSLIANNILVLPPNKKLAARERDEMISKQAKKAFERHEIMSEGEGRWTIAKKYEDTGKWQSFYLAEIIVCRVGVFVSGDIDSVIFAGGDRGSSPRAMVGWVGRHSGADGYLTEKASIGFNASTRNPAETTDEDVAISEMQDHVFSEYLEICQGVTEEYNDGSLNERPVCTAEFEYETGRIKCEDAKGMACILRTVDARLSNNKRVAVWATAIEDLRSNCNLEEIKHRLYDDLNDAGLVDAWEYIGDLGVVTDARVHYAHAACAKLCELLDAREADREAAIEGEP